MEQILFYCIMFGDMIALYLLYDIISRTAASAFALLMVSIKGEKTVRCRNLDYETKVYAVPIVNDLVLVVLFLSLNRYSHSLFLCALPIVIQWSIYAILNVGAILRGKYAYLSSKGLIFYYRCFKFGKSDFSWQIPEEQQGANEILHISYPNVKAHFRADFDINTERAHQIISESRYLS